MSHPAVIFVVAFVALYVGHQVGDQWVQRDSQALNKHRPGRAGRVACTAHVVGLTVAKLATLLVTVAVLEVHLSWQWTGGAFLVDVGSHWWADRRTTLGALAQLVGKGPYWRLGQPPARS